MQLVNASKKAHILERKRAEEKKCYREMKKTRCAAS
jgi:hypothetical protein